MTDLTFCDREAGEEARYRPWGVVSRVDRAPARPTVITDARRAPEGVRGGGLLLGNFDGSHIGHHALLNAARAAVPDGPLGIMSCEPHPKQFFAASGTPFRLSTFQTKISALRATGVSYLYMPRFDASFAAQEPEAFVNGMLVAGLGIRHVVVGEDFRFGRRRRGDVSLLRRLGRGLGFRVSAVGEVCDNEVRISSTLVRQLIASGDIAGANAMLGQPWRLPCESNFGGGAMNAPIEMQFPDEVILPKAGVYRVRVESSGRSGSDLGIGQMTVDSSRHCLWYPLSRRTAVISPPAGNSHDVEWLRQEPTI